MAFADLLVRFPSTRDPKTPRFLPRSRAPEDPSWLKFIYYRKLYTRALPHFIIIYRRRARNFFFLYFFFLFRNIFITGKTRPIYLANTEQVFCFN